MLQEIRCTGGLTAGDLLVSVSYAQGDTWNNTSFDASLLGCGGGDNNPLKFLDMPVIPANTQINIQMQNTSGVAIAFEIQFWGQKLIKE